MLNFIVCWFLVYIALGLILNLFVVLIYWFSLDCVGFRCFVWAILLIAFDFDLINSLDVISLVCCACILWSFGC